MSRVKEYEEKQKTHRLDDIMLGVILGFMTQVVYEMVHDYLLPLYPVPFKAWATLASFLIVLMLVGGVAVSRLGNLLFGMASIGVGVMSLMLFLMLLMSRIYALNLLVPLGLAALVMIALGVRQMRR